MTNYLILDLDGVLITTPSWKPDALSSDGYSDFQQSAVSNLNQLLDSAMFEIWLSSSRRTQKSLKEFNNIFANREINQAISGFLPELPIKSSRLDEIQNFIKTLDSGNYLIIDDDKTLGGLAPEQKNKWIQTEPMIGFSDEKLAEALQKVEKWRSQD